MTKVSALGWEITLIVAMLLFTPVSMYFAEGALQESEEIETVFEATGEDDFGRDGVYHTASDQTRVYLYYGYSNYTNDPRLTDSNFYFADDYDLEKNEFVMAEHPDDDDGFEEFDLWAIQLNYSIPMMLENDINRISLEIKAPRNATAELNIGYATESTNSYRKDFFDDKEYQFEKGLNTIELEVKTTQLLEAESTIEADGDDPDKSALGIRISQLDLDQDNDFLEPGDVMQTSYELGSTYAVSPLFTTNLFAGLMGVLLIPVALFSSPWIDFMDVFGPLINALRRS